jgi:hypothetical protein
MKKINKYIFLSSVAFVSYLHLKPLKNYCLENFNTTCPGLIFRKKLNDLLIIIYS